MIIYGGIPAPTRPRRGREPRYHRDVRTVPWLLALLAALLVLVGTFLGRQHDTEALQLSDAKLSGERLQAGKLCIAVAADLSGSMAGVAQQRRDAIAALLPWLRDNLRPGDQVALAAFTSTAVLVLPPIGVDHLSASPPDDPSLPGGGTRAVPAIAVLGQAFHNRGCALIELIMITDGRFGDNPTKFRAALTQAQISRTHILNPNGRVRPMQLRHPGLADVEVLPLGDSNAQAITFARIIAELTGQNLTRA
jgi:Mg-chelatase subunit ChlD